jgi:hypothetical protein
MENIKQNFTNKRGLINTNKFYQKKKKTNKRFSDQPRVSRKMASKMINKIGNFPMHKEISNDYMDTLLYPECNHATRVPGKSAATVAWHRKFTFQIATTPAGTGAVGVFWQPCGLSDATNNRSTVYLTNATYDGVTTIGALEAASIATLTITDGVASAYRLVSASMHIVPQAAVNAQQGTIHAALIPMKPQLLAGVGTASTAGTTAQTLVGALQNTPYYKEASISALEGARIVWMPEDECPLEFCAVNANLNIEGSTNSNNTLVANIVGCPSGVGTTATTFRVDLYVNFELLPAAASVLQGSESYTNDPRRPEETWFKIYHNDPKDHIIQVSPAVSSISNINPAVTKDRMISQINQINALLAKPNKQSGLLTR